MHEGWLDDGTMHRWETGEALIASTHKAYGEARSAYLAAVRAQLASVIRAQFPTARYLGVNVTRIQADRGNSVKAAEVTSAFDAIRLCDCGCAPTCEGACPCGGRSAEDAGRVIAGAGEYGADLDEGWIGVLAEFDDPDADDTHTYAYDLDTGVWSRSIHLIEESDDDDD